MDLQTLWFVLIAVLCSGYLILEGFDFGVGILLPVVGRTEAHRSGFCSTGGNLILQVEGSAAAGARKEKDVSSLRRHSSE